MMAQWLQSLAVDVYWIILLTITDDGLCVIDIEHLSFRSDDTSSLAEISAAALDLLDECIFGKKAGGVIMGMGKSTNQVYPIQA